MRKSGAKTCVPQILLPILQTKDTHLFCAPRSGGILLYSRKPGARRLPRPVEPHLKARKRMANYDRDNSPVFSRTVKAGKRVYYLDVKRDRHGEYYIAMTESKRVYDGTETERPVFEKHKIFLYREDIVNFLSALTDAAQYVGEHRPLDPHEHRYDEGPADAELPLVADEFDKIDLDGDFNIEF